MFLTINDTDSSVEYINFSNIYHKFELDEQVPYLSTYIPEESMFLERRYIPLDYLPEKQVATKAWSEWL